jgi:hypothetical protein
MSIGRLLGLCPAVVVVVEVADGIGEPGSMRIGQRIADVIVDVPHHQSHSQQGPRPPYNQGNSRDPQRKGNDATVAVDPAAADPEPIGVGQLGQQQTWRNIPFGNGKIRSHNLNIFCYMIVASVGKWIGGRRGLEMGCRGKCRCRRKLMFHTKLLLLLLLLLLLALIGTSIWVTFNISLKFRENAK